MLFRSKLDAQSDVIHLTKEKILNNAGRLQALGINTTGLDVNTTLRQIERRLRLWLTEEDRDFAGT